MRTKRLPSPTASRPIETLIIEIEPVIAAALIAIVSAGVTGTCLAGGGPAGAEVGARPGDDGYFLYPAISRDRIVFTSEEDLWTVPAEGGVARRLTKHEGLEADARFSPDGERIAFSAEYGGNRDVYVMPREGGEPVRLTFHPASDQPVGWRPDGSEVIFRSARNHPHGAQEVFSVPAGGGCSRSIPVDLCSWIAFRPDGRTAALVPIGREFRTWKRYRGGLAEDIWVGDVEEGVFRRVTDFEGIDTFPMWHDGRIYFLSDRDGVANIWSMAPDGSDARQHTRHTAFDARWPSIGDGRIVYMYAGGLRVLDLRDGSDRTVDVRLPSDRAGTMPRYVTAPKFLTDYEPSPDGKRLLVGMRGDIFSVPIEEGRAIPVATSSESREKFPSYAPDGKRIAAWCDASGEEQLTIFEVYGDAPPKTIPTALGGWHFHPEWSPDGKKIAFADMTCALSAVRIEDGSLLRIDRSDVDEITEYVWSPDSRWIAYAKPEENRFSSIFIADTEAPEGEIRPIRVTGTDTLDLSPAFDPAGRYLFFLSRRTFNPLLGSMDFEMILDRMTRPYLVMLRAGDKSPLLARQPEDDGKPEKPEKKNDEKKNDEKKNGEKKDDSPKVRIDVEGLEDRVHEIPVAAGHYAHLAAVRDRILFISSPSRGLLEGEAYPKGQSPPPSELRAYDIEGRKELVYATGVNGYALSAGGKRIVVSKGSQLFAGDPRGSLEGKPIDLSGARIRVEPRSEWRQIFREAWRLHRDFYWAANMAGNDWEAIRARYEPLLDRIGTRNELNDLLGQMISELATSHTYVGGGDIERAPSVDVGLLGADLVPDAEKGGFRIERILRGTRGETRAASPLALSYLDIREGDAILAVDGRPLEAAREPWAVLEALAGDQVRLTVARGSEPGSRRDCIVETLRSESDLRYIDWVERTRAWVDEHSKGEVGYIHIPDMGGNGLAAFERAFLPQIRKRGLVVDLRFNRGGFISQLIIARLKREIWAFMRPRRGMAETYPAHAFRGHLVVLCNERTGSDGDIFCQSVQILGLGPVIGTRTWGGVVGIRGGKPFVDGGQTMVPEFAWWEPRSGWALENRGVIPDVVVEQAPGRLARGFDDQLAKGLEILLDRMRREPMDLPSPPPEPDKGRDVPGERPRGGRV
ncbi:MAG: PD40 domain-containing protein [Planctomycetes bacterium]|nr:PD40 domain-containing protein [Planctomycetota bacterium]